MKIHAWLIGVLTAATMSSPQASSSDGPPREVIIRLLQTAAVGPLVQITAKPSIWSTSVWGVTADTQATRVAKLELCRAQRVIAAMKPAKAGAIGWTVFEKQQELAIALVDATTQCDEVPQDRYLTVGESVQLEHVRVLLNTAFDIERCARSAAGCNLQLVQADRDALGTVLAFGGLPSVSRIDFVPGAGLKGQPASLPTPCILSAIPDGDLQLLGLVRQGQGDQDRNWRHGTLMIWSSDEMIANAFSRTRSSVICAWTRMIANVPKQADLRTDCNHTSV